MALGHNMKKGLQQFYVGGLFLFNYLDAFLSMGAIEEQRYGPRT